MRVECTDTPISWLELERYVLGESRNEEVVRGHLAECEACSQVTSAIGLDARVMPALVIPVAEPRRVWWKRMAAFAPALLLPAILLLVLWPSAQPQFGAGAKGDALSITLVRERGGVLLAPTHHAPTDRFKVLVTCAPGVRLVDLLVLQDGALNLPISTTRLDCGNAVAIPGAFTLDGGDAEVCVQIVSEKDQGNAVLRDDAVCHLVASETPLE